MPGFITRATLKEKKELVIRLWGEDFYKFAMTRKEGTPFLTAWAQFNFSS